MFVRSSFGSAAACGLLASLAGDLGLAPTALAQEVRIGVFNREDSGAPAGMISKRSAEKYASLLSLTEDQKEALQALHDGYTTEYQAATKEQRDAMAEISRSFEESQDPSIFREKMPAIRAKNRERTQALEKSFMGDVQALLTPAQAQQWPKVERHRRRETTLRGGLSGESVNLLDIVESLKVPASGPIAMALDEYELDLDRALAAKERVIAETPDAGGGGAFNVEEFQERMAKAREAGLKVREVNERHARKIEALISEEQRAEFGGAVRRDTFPRVYRPSRVSRMFDAALKFDDLTSEQRESISALRGAYQRDAGPINDRWASAIEAEERDGSGGGTMVLPGGGTMQVRLGAEDDNSPVAQARKARRELDDRMREKLEATLTPAQKEKLPKGQDREDVHMMGGEGGAFVGQQIIVEDRNR